MSWFWRLDVPEGSVDGNEEQYTNLGQDVILRVLESEEPKTCPVSTDEDNVRLEQLTDQD